MAGPLAAADRAYQEARSAVAAYRLQEARAHLDEAQRHLRGVPDGDGFELGLRVRLTESWLVCDESGLPAALARIEDVLQEASAAGRDGIRALAHIQAGVLCARAGNFDDAMGQLRPAAALSASLPADDRVRLLLNKGTIGSRAGSLDEAAEDLRGAAAAAGALPAYRFMALHNLGFVEYLRGDFPAALGTMAQADGLDVDVDRSVARHDRARVLLEAGLVDDAADLLERAAVELQAAGLAEEHAEARLDQARCAALAGRPGDAERIARGVVADAAGRGEDARAQEARAVRLEALVLSADAAGTAATGAAAAEAVDPASAAAGAAAEAADPAAAGGLAEEAGALAAEARAARRPWLADRATALQVIAGGDPVLAARPDVVRCLRRMRRSPYLATRVLAVVAQLSLTTGPARRGRLLREAAADTAAARAGVASLDLRTAVATHLAPLLRLDLRRAAAAGDGWTALQATERWRAALESVPSVVPPSDPSLAALWSGLRRNHEELRTAPPEEAEALRAAAARTERELRERHWAGKAQARAARREPLSRARLGRAVVLSYFWAAGTLQLVHLEPGRPAVLLNRGSRPEVVDLVDQATADAAAAAHAPAGPLQAAVLSSLGESLERLDALLLPDTLVDGPIVVVPSGELSRLPWRMLPRLRGRGMVLSRSVGAWAARSTALAGTPRVAVAAGPDLSLAPLECADVASNWAGAVAVPAEPAAVKAALADYDVVHLAAHGRHREDNPLFSSLRLHGGSLFAHELEQVRIRASLVVLSACGAGRGRLRPGDEALGLTSSLLAMGVRAVVAPLTDVPDTVAARTMAGLHRHLAAGEDGPAALAAASDGLLDHSFAWFGSDWRAGRNA